MGMAPFDWHELATKKDLEQVATKAELNGLGTELRGEMNDLGTALRTEMNDLGTELRAEMNGGFQILTIDTDAPEMVTEDGVEASRLAVSAGDDPGGALAARYLGEASSAVYLIRPDQHVAARRPSFDENQFRHAIRRAIGKE